MKPLKSERAKTYSSDLASKSGGAFALPALQLVPPLPLTIKLILVECTDFNDTRNTYFFASSMEELFKNR